MEEAAAERWSLELPAAALRHGWERISGIGRDGLCSGTVWDNFCEFGPSGSKSSGNRPAAYALVHAMFGLFRL